MKLQLGKQYIRKDGKTTGFLVNNDQDAIAFPFLDPVHGVKYDDHGWPKTSGESGIERRIIKEVSFDNYPKELNKILAENMGGKLDAKQKHEPVEYRPDIVVISRKEYDRFKEMEVFIKEIYTFAKENLK